MTPHLAIVAVLLAFGLARIGSIAQAVEQRDSPAKVVAPLRFVVTPGGTAVNRYFSTGSLDGEPDAERAIIVVHGLSRNADAYEATGEAAVRAGGAAAAHTIVVTPQFLDDVDVAVHRLPGDTLRWSHGTWLDGQPALGPVPLSAFDVLDALLARLSDRKRFPAMKEIVVAGHSAGGQLVQRYAVAGRAPSGDVAVRYVVANPSSYVYFTPDRPVAGADDCPRYNYWKYGLGDPPPYVRNTAGLEAAYVNRPVTYLLGLLDTDPHHPLLDRSCAGELEGAYRLVRGRNYVKYLHERHPGGTNQQEVDVPGVDHDGQGMFTSPCGSAVLFGAPLKTCAVTKV
ncbi:MAG: alpha/beta hydrolase [Vulcanimicrobiaceae bacterium]